VKPPLPLDEAQQRLLELAAPLGCERVAAAGCSGRYLAEDLQALRTQPAADLSAMDGYAVHVAAALTWRIVGESAAGHPFNGSLAPGEAVRISTGALLPLGADAVLLQEEALRDREHLALAARGEPSPRHIRRRGFDFAAGEAILTRGYRLAPPQLALAIVAGHADALPVGRLPSIAVIDSGDELVTSAQQWDSHQLPASNGAMVAALAAPFARSVHRLGPVPDRLDALAQALAQAAQADVIVTTGGASVGDHDLIRPALEEWGATIDFWRVAMRPGKPLLVARRGATFVLGLPGNPVSSFVTAYLFLLPLLRKLAGANQPLPDIIELTLDAPLPAVGTRLEFVRGRQRAGVVTPQAEQDSSALRALAQSNVLIRREIAAPAARTGDRVQAYWLESGGIA
jgi:molybdopterin molybdotransferase